MKRAILSLILGVGLLQQTNAQKAPVEHTWYNAEKTSKIQIYKAVDGKYYGKITWLKDPNDANGKPRTDINNPKENLRNTPLLNYPMLKGFTQNKDDANIYEDGTVYDPRNGKTYCGKLTVDGKELKLKGFICGLSLFSRTNVWTLADE